MCDRKKSLWVPWSRTDSNTVKTKCYFCGKVKQCRHLVLIDYSGGGGWVEDGMYCKDCETKLANYMSGLDRN